MIHRHEMPTRLLADLLGRLGVAVGAGIDVRRAWKMETARVPARWRSAMDIVGRELADGASLSEALRTADGVFPPLVCAMVEVGDRTGREPETLRELAASLAESDCSRRQLRASLVKPALQLLLALGVVGLLIVVSGSIGDLDGRPFDMLGLGLEGLPGLIRYGLILGGVAAAVTILGRQWRDRGAVRQWLMRLPMIGPALVAAEAAAWCRAASLAGHAGLDAGTLVRLASGAAPGLRIAADEIEGRLRAGATLDAALAAGRRLPRRVIEAVGVGELTGTTPETLDRLGRQLDEEARARSAAAVAFASWAVWAAVALLIAWIVVRFFSFYAGLIDAAARPRSVF